MKRLVFLILPLLAAGCTGTSARFRVRGFRPREWTTASSCHLWSRNPMTTPVSPSLQRSICFFPHPIGDSCEPRSPSDMDMSHGENNGMTSFQNGMTREG